MPLFSFVTQALDHLYEIGCLTLQENRLFSRANTLENTQTLSEKLIFEWDMPSIFVVLSLIGNVKFPISC